jgi:hypothetical protein
MWLDRGGASAASGDARRSGRSPQGCRSFGHAPKDSGRR